MDALAWISVPDGILAGAILGLIFWVAELFKAQDHGLDPGGDP